MFHVFGAIVHFERGLISERTRDGIAVARKRGRATHTPCTRSRDGFGRAETYRSRSVARSSGKTARDWQGNGLQTRRRNAPRSFFAFNVILGTNLPMTPRRSLQRIAPMPGGASKTLEITFSVDFIVEEGTNRILWVDSNPYTYPT